MNLRTDRSCSLSSTQSITFFGLILLVLLLSLNFCFGRLERTAAIPVCFRAWLVKVRGRRPQRVSPENEAHDPAYGSHARRKTATRQTTSVQSISWGETLLQSD